MTILIQTQTFKSLFFPTGQNPGALLFSCGPLSGDRYWFSLLLIGPCGSPQQDLDTALRSQQGCQHIQIVGLCRSCLHSQLLSPKVQKSTVETIWEWWMRHSCHQQQRDSAEKKLQKKISGEISRETCWGVTTFTPPTATSLHAAGWLTRASCTASGGAVIARTSSKHKYMICCSWLLGWKFTFTTFPRCTDKKGQVSVHVSLLVMMTFGSRFVLWFAVWRHESLLFHSLTCSPQVRPSSHVSSRYSAKHKRRKLEPVTLQCG